MDMLRRSQWYRYLLIIHNLYDADQYFCRIRQANKVIIDILLDRYQKSKKEGKVKIRRGATDENIFLGQISGSSESGTGCQAEHSTLRFRR